MNSAACHQLRRNQPAARHNASPISGTQASANAGVPYLRTFSTCFSCCVCGNIQPMPKVTMPPSVLPSVPSSNAGQNNSGCSFKTPNSTASEPPGSKVAARKLLMNNPHRLKSLVKRWASESKAIHRSLIACARWAHAEIGAGKVARPASMLFLRCQQISDRAFRHFRREAQRL